MSPEASSERQDHFRKKSQERFGALKNYVDEKYLDRFPILGNLQVAEYIRNYLEFLFKRHFIADHLTPEERQSLEESSTSVAEYLKGLEVGQEVLSQGVSASFIGLNPQDVRKKILQLERRLGEERKIINIKERIAPAREKFFASMPPLRVLDCGPAIGAISSMLAMKVLHEYGLLDRATFCQLDISRDVLQSNRQGNFEYNEELIKILFGSRETYEMLKEKLKTACLVRGAVDDRMPFGDDTFDITIAAFLMHHIANEGKQTAADELVRVSGGGVFVADEYFKDYHAEFGARHAGDQIPLAPEEPLPLKESIQLFFPQLIGRNFTQVCPEAYAYWGIKHWPTFPAPTTTSPTKLA